MSRAEFLFTPDSLPSYLVGRGLVGTEADVRVRELQGGVSNVVLLIEWPNEPERRWVSKQSLGKLRVEDDWRSDRERIFREAGVLPALRPALGASIPEVIHTDPGNYLYVMTTAPLGSVVWKESLLAGARFAVGIAREAGLLLARMINASRSTPQFRESFEDRKVFDQLRIDPYYRTAAARHPDVQSILRELIADTLKIQTSLVHGDYSPKNMLVRGGKIFLIDFEVVHWGDPAFDSGFLLNHLFLKAFHQACFAELYVEAARAFWKALVAALGPDGASDFEVMTLRHVGALMLARIDGKSPVEYIRDDRIKERARLVAKRILLERPTRLADVFELITRAD